MADIVKTSKTLSIVAEFADGDDRTLTITNPRSDLTWDNDIAPLAEKASKVLIGDRQKANFTRFREANIKTTDVVYLDIPAI